MTLTHISHFGLEKLSETSDSILFTGTLAACKRMAAAHGMEIDTYEGFILGMDGTKAHYTSASPAHFSRIWFKNGGMIQKGRDNYTLVMPLKVWIND